MKTAFHLAALPWIVALATIPMSALAQSDPTEPPFEAALDIDSDGRMDRAVIAQDADSGQAELSIYLAAGDGKLDPSRQPDFVKKALTEDRILALESKGKGSLVVTSCFGCGANKSTEATLTIVYRQGKFLVAGYSRDWDWNVHKSDGTVETTLGGCDMIFSPAKASPRRISTTASRSKGRSRRSIWRTGPTTAAPNPASFEEPRLNARPQRPSRPLAASSSVISTDILVLASAARIMATFSCPPETRMMFGMSDSSCSG